MDLMTRPPYVCKSATPSPHPPAAPHGCNALIAGMPVQDIALLDARRGVTMFDKISVPRLGIVENMSYHQCKACGHKEFLFGENGAVRTAHDLGLEVLGQVKLFNEMQRSRASQQNTRRNF